MLKGKTIDNGKINKYDLRIVLLKLQPSGVRQSSVLGPTFFLLYTKPLRHVTRHIAFLLTMPN